MSNPSRHGGIVSVHIGPASPLDRYVIAQNGAVLKQNSDSTWKTMPGLTAAVVRTWPVDISLKARAMTSHHNGVAAHREMLQRQRETPLLRKVRLMREGAAGR